MGTVLDTILEHHEELCERWTLDVNIGMIECMFINDCLRHERMVVMLTLTLFW